MPDKWDTRYLALAKEVASWSKDPRAKVGALLVGPDRRQLIPGYNGFPRGVNDAPEMYADRELKHARVVHAEVNAILQARRDLTGYTIYVWPFFPCADCAGAIINAGITTVKCPKAILGEPWKSHYTHAQTMFRESGVRVYEL